ncbi:hypothetical protein [Amycolatopsis taiwanensis]|uniref:hypothetical protein n=1 Tax=Amycolatopsis taiwanensis TaxID=342230 RepID=UPI0004AC8C7E|nr:hypothetical protein [Amycolatopsis taiwanensis]
MDLLKELVASLPSASLCGPVPFMAAVKAALLKRGVAAERIRYEVFGPDRELATA